MAAALLSAEVESDEALLVRLAVFALPAEQRAVNELAYFGGLSCPEIADRLGIPLGTVKSRLRLALGRLRTRLAVERQPSPSAPTTGPAAATPSPPADHDRAFPGFAVVPTV